MRYLVAEDHHKPKYFAQMGRGVAILDTFEHGNEGIFYPEIIQTILLLIYLVYFYDRVGSETSDSILHQCDEFIFHFR